ncbi:PGF-CTERM sorting domain-containing protein [Halegenticoccus tardaugens]|uniref:PGF-CTERM sorting domain-containing protein n=1 Tax=Halegenticoccus tardaugens TaxID=2071624 RepID=UPI00100B677D|nr:PGF-CTERM sorting domain-containing protein [Halegenticoccus tardaugens]
MTALLVTAGLAPLSTAQSDAESAAYAGSTVSFDTDETAVTNYSVGDERLFSSIKVQARSDAGNGGILNIGPSLSSVVPLDGSRVDLSSETETTATVETKSGATIEAHDNDRGVLVVRTESRSQYVQLNASDDAEASYEGGMAVVRGENGTEAAAFVVGDGQISAEGDSVVANIDKDDRLVVRSYEQERGTADTQQERLIKQEEVAAETYVMQRENGTVDDVVAYDPGTTVDVTSGERGSVEMTVEREDDEGTMLLATVSSDLLDADSLAVGVDGVLADETDSYSALESAADGDEPRYLVTETGANGTVNVLVAGEGLSDGNLVLRSGQNATAGLSAADESEDSSGADESSDSDEGTGSEGESDGETGAQVPGFGVAVAAAALLATAALLARRR